MAMRYIYEKPERVLVKYQCPNIKGCSDAGRCEHATPHKKIDACIVTIEHDDSWSCPACVIVEPYRIPPPFISKEEMTL